MIINEPVVRKWDMAGTMLGVRLLRTKGQVVLRRKVLSHQFLNTVELQWLEHLWNQKNIIAPGQEE